MSTARFNLRRRWFLAASGILLMPLVLPRVAKAEDVVEIEMSGTGSGSHVWFRPRGLLLQPGQKVRWINRDTGNSHTATAYHPDNHKPLRIPEKASSWDSGYLLPGESFEWVFEEPGVYDYFCLPHEFAGMVGRIVVGDVENAHPYQETDSKLPEAALEQLPALQEIRQKRSVD